ncbi:MAG: FMN-binding protein [Omnitrophica bacterium]|nr:FMN-binding protein [Candidatus Omnitrophota bacterium]
MFNSSLKMIAVLTIVGLLSGGFLTFVDQQTAPAIESRGLESLSQAVFKVLPDAVDYKKIKLEDVVIYQGLDKRGKKIGLAFLAAGSGYQGEIKIMVGVAQDFNRLQNIQILESIETPGLGGRITEDDFRKQFQGLAISEKIKLGKAKETKQPTVQAITGATISSKAVVDIIDQKISTIKKLLKEQE